MTNERFGKMQALFNLLDESIKEMDERREESLAKQQEACDRETAIADFIELVKQSPRMPYSGAVVIDGELVDVLIEAMMKER